MTNLYKWQEQALDILLDKKELLTEAATGTGKSLLAITAIQKIRDKHPEYNFLIVAPKIVILEKVWRDELYAAGFGPNIVGIYYSSGHEFSKITLTTMASIPRIDFQKFPVDVLIVDEIHNMMSPSLIKLLQHPFKYKLGLSASIKRRDQQHWKMLKYFNYSHYEYTMKQAIADGIINKFNFTFVGVEIVEPEIRAEYDKVNNDYRQVLINGGGFEKINMLPASDPIKIQMLSLLNKRADIVNNYLRKVDVVCDIIAKHKDNKLIVFSQYNKLSRNTYWKLKELDIDSEIIDTGIKQKLREKYLEEFEQDKYNILLSSRIFEEGYNLPKMDCAIFISSNSSSRQIIQRLGRILRKKDNISEAYYIYCTDTFEQEYAATAREYVEDCAENIVEMKV